MANANFANGGLLSAAIGSTSLDAKLGLGQRADLNNGGEAIYVQANGAVTGQGYVCSIDPTTWKAVMLSTANDFRGNIVAVPTVAFADQEYGWMIIKGPTQVFVGASCLANTQLNTTATPGMLDDDATSTTFRIDGAVLTTARGGTNGLAPAMLNYPIQGAVI